VSSRSLASLLAVALFAAASPLRASEPAAALHVDRTLEPQLDRSLADRQPLIVASTSDNFPYGYLDSTGRWQGFAVDLLDAVARVSNLQIQRAVGPGQAIYDRFRKGEFDVLQAYSETPERHAFADFSVPILTLQGAVFVRKNGSPIRTLQDLNGRRFAMIGRASIGEKFLSDHHLAAKIVPVDSSEQALGMVNNGECDATFVSQLTAAATVRREKLTNVTIFGRPYADYDIRHCFAVHKGDAQLLARLNEGLAILRSTGEFDEIYRRWFGRLGMPLFTQVELVSYVAIALAIGLAATLWGLMRQRTLRQRLAGQAEQLAEKEALLRALYENIPVAICVFETRAESEWLISANRHAAGFIGRAPEPGAPIDLRELAGSMSWAAELLTLLPRRPQPGGFIQDERSTTDRRLIVFTLVSLAVGQRGAARLCVLMEDITQRRSLDEEVAQTRKMRALGELVSGIAHEFNNLLTPILISASMIQEEHADNPALQQQVSTINQVAHRAADLTQRLLAFGRKGDRAPESLSIEAIVDTCISLLEHTVDRRVVWENQVPRGLPLLYVNRTDVNQVLINLLINARDTLLDKLAAPPMGWTPRIRVTAKALPVGAASLPPSAPRGGNSRASLLGWQMLAVSDNGLGMSDEVRERIFEPFYTTKEVGKGTGLGLATVWRLVSSMGGRIEVESKPNEGSTFRILLPVWPAPTPPAETQRAEAPAPTAVRAARVLVAEDEPAVARVVTSALTRSGHTVSHAENGHIAWNRLSASHGEFDLLLVDINMPVMDGIEFLGRARTAGYSGKVIIMSGRLGSNDLGELNDCAPDRLLAKPFTAQQLLQAVAETLGSEPPHNN
jgi:signal transduction histidine kinase/CheY-like chemotaxis protein